jgi:AcrR family transcriptional regulator
MSTRIRDDGHTQKRKPVRAPVQARSRATVEAILGGTARVLALRGYAGCTTNHIADAAGVSIGSFYQYFSDKDSAIAALAGRVAFESLAYSSEHLTDAEDDRARIYAWLAALAARVASQEALLRALFQEVPYIWSNPHIQAAFADSLDVAMRLDPRGAGSDDRRGERALIVVKSVVAVLLEIATNPELQERRDVVVDELSAMIAGYLLSGP